MSWLLNPKLWIGLAIAAVLAFSHVFVYRAGSASVQGLWDKAQLEQQQEATAAEEKARTEEARRQAVNDQEAQDAQARITQLESDVAGARAAGDKLRAAVRAAVSGARAHPAPAAASSGEPGSDALDLLGELFSRSSSRTDELGQYADRLRIAGLACERISDGLQPAAGQQAGR